MSNITVFTKQYDGESLYDLGRDIAECFDPKYNEVVKEVPQDQYGFQSGTFTVTISWNKPNGRYYYVSR